MRGHGVRILGDLQGIGRWGRNRNSVTGGTTPGSALDVTLGMLRVRRT